jgi:hypothetical protein
MRRSFEPRTGGVVSLEPHDALFGRRSGRPYETLLFRVPVGRATVPAKSSVLVEDSPEARYVLSSRSVLRGVLSERR